MSDKSFSTEISGDASPLIAALNQAREATAEAAANMREQLSTIQESATKLKDAFLAFGALLAGGGVFKEVIEATNQWTESNISLSLILGISTERASAYLVQIREAGGSAQDVQAAVAHLTREVRTHEKALNDMGIATRDASGHLLDSETIYWNAIDAVNGYKEGTDRNLAAQTAFGRGIDSTNAILRTHRQDLDEAAEHARKLELIIGKDAVKAFESNRKAMADASLTMEGMKVKIGNGLIPVIIALGQAFSGESTEMAQVFGEMLVWVGKAVMNLWYGLKELGTFLGGFAAAANAAIHGNFGEARTIMTQMKADLKAMREEGDKAVATIGKIALPKKDVAKEEAPKGTKLFNLDVPAPKDDKRLERFKNDLAEMAKARGDFDQKDYATDLQFWQQKLALTGTSTAADKALRIDIQKEINSLERKQHDESIKMAADEIKTKESLALGEIESKRAALQQQLALGKITRVAELQGEVELENEKLKIQQKSLDDQRALATFDLQTQKKLDDEKLKLEQKHAADVQKILNKEVLEEKKVWDGLFSKMESGFANVIGNFLKGTQSLSATVKGLFSSVATSTAATFAQMAAKNISTMLAQAAVGDAIRAKQILGDAQKAASGAYSAIAGIPYVGPFLAPAAAAVAFAATLAFDKSAAGGYDIPASVNPVVQTHAQEMILPASIANPLRQMIKRGALGGGGDTYISAVDARSFQKALTGSGSRSPLSKGIRNLAKRNYKI